MKLFTKGSNTHASRPKRTSELFTEIAEACDHRWTIRDLCHALGTSAFSMILLILSLPNTIPLPIPGISTVTGLPLAFFAFQLCVGREEIWLPKALANKSISGDKLKIVILRVIPWLKKLEKLLKPRIEIMTSRKAQIITGVLLVVLSCIIALPIPLGNLAPGIAMTALALGLSERDGLMLLIAWGLSLLALVYIVMLVSGYGWIIWRTINAIFG